MQLQGPIIVYGIGPKTWYIPNMKQNMIYENMIYTKMFYHDIYHMLLLEKKLDIYQKLADFM